MAARIAPPPKTRRIVNQRRFVFAGAMVVVWAMGQPGEVWGSASYEKTSGCGSPHSVPLLEISDRRRVDPFCGNVYGPAPSGAFKRPDSVLTLTDGDIPFGNPAFPHPNNTLPFSDPQLSTPCRQSVCASLAIPENDSALSLSLHKEVGTMKRVLLSVFAVALLTMSTGCCSWWWPWGGRGGACGGYYGGGYYGSGACPGGNCGVPGGGGTYVQPQPGGAYYRGLDSVESVQFPSIRRYAPLGVPGQQSAARCVRTGIRSANGNGSATVPSHLLGIGRRFERTVERLLSVRRLRRRAHDLAPATLSVPIERPHESADPQ